MSGYCPSLLKLTSISDSEASGPGSKRQRLTASCAAAASSGWPDSTLVLETAPSGWTVTRRTTVAADVHAAGEFGIAGETRVTTAR